MRDIHISHFGTKLDYKKASEPAASMAAGTLGVTEPAVVVCYNEKSAMPATWLLHRN